MSEVNRLMPVTLPPGRLRLETSPTRSGSLTAENTTGIVEVVALAASAEGGPPPPQRTRLRADERAQPPKPASGRSGLPPSETRSPDFDPRQTPFHRDLGGTLRQRPRILPASGC